MIQQTGTIRIVGAFANPGNLLRPGQFGRIRAMTASVKGARCWFRNAPSPNCRAAIRLPWSAPDNSVSIRAVQAGDRIGAHVDHQQRSEPGERVVSEGTSKVRDGTVVNPKPDT